VWTVSNVTNSSVSFTFYDPGQYISGMRLRFDPKAHYSLECTELVGGFPASVLAEITYSLLPGGIWDIVLNANASARTRMS